MSDGGRDTRTVAASILTVSMFIFISSVGFDGIMSVVGYGQRIPIHHHVGSAAVGAVMVYALTVIVSWSSVSGAESADDLE